MEYNSSLLSKNHPPTNPGSPSINLHVGTGARSGGPSHVIKEGKSAFTASQRHELHQQALIFKNIVAGLPLPVHPVLPIRQSVTSSFVSANVIGSSPQGFDYRSKMNPEPVRCVRTDGKKWRCRREVVPDHKYCERHVHRSRRSRKRVEASLNNSQSDTTTIIKSSNTSQVINSSNTTNSKSNASISIPTNLQLATSGGGISATDTTSSISGRNASKNTIDLKNDLSATPTTLNSCNTNVSINRDTTTTTFINAATKGGNRISSNCTDGRDANLRHINSRNNYISNNNNNNGISSSYVVPGVGFSIRSVLQDGRNGNRAGSGWGAQEYQTREQPPNRAIHFSNSGIDLRAGIETKLQRCKRTDGKKWRCSRNVVSGKYCELHLHRAKRARAS